MVKLASISDSTRYFVGYDEQGKELFYTELKLIFETQGDAVAYSVSEIDTTYNIDNNTFTFTKSKDNSKIYLMFKNADKSMQDDIINYLVQNKVYDQNIVKWCKDFFNYNLLPVLSNTAE